MMDEAALAALAADIKAESQREPIFLWRDQIIDGRNRYAACKIAGVEPTFKRVEFPGGEAEALAYVLSRNLKRRHLTIAQRSVIAAKAATLKRGQTQDRSNTATAVSVPTQAQAAEMLKVSVDSVQRARIVLDRGGPELVAAVESGEVGLHKAAETVRRDADDKVISLNPAEANRQRVADEDARYRMREARKAIARLTEDERRSAGVGPITIDAIKAWSADALDSENRQAADATFNAIKADAEKLKHDEVVKAWLEEYERGDALE
jgi:ParB-like chromosome segregation protein Spo0J